MAKSGSNILREFLIAIGFDVDEQAFKNFQTKETSIIKQFETMIKVAAVAGTAVAGAVLKIANDMEQLYFSSERAGTSVKGLMMLRFGGAQAGIGADAMASAVEQMASTIRANPGMVAFFHQLGLPVFADNAKNFANLIGKLRDMDARGGGVMARMIGAQFGFDEQTLTLLFKNYPDFLRGLKEQADLLKISGVNAQKFGEDSHAAMEDWRTLLLHLEALGYLFAQDVLPTVDKFVVFLTKSLDLLFQLDKATKGWSTTIGGIVIGIGGAAAALGAIGSILGIGGGAVAGVVAAVATPEVAAGALGVAGLIAGYEGLRRLPYKDIAGRATIGYGHLIRAGEDFSGGITQSGAAALLAQDTEAARAAIFRMVKVALNSNQAAALTDLIYNVGAGALKGSTLLKDLNSGDYAGASDQFLRFNHALVGGHLQTVDALTSRRIADRDLFNKPDVSMTQTTNIRIEGVSDPREAGQVVASHQNRINGDLVRNMAGAVQ
jgi:lysozyme